MSLAVRVAARYRSERSTTCNWCRLVVYGGRSLLVLAVLLTVATGVGAASGHPVDVTVTDLNGNGTVEDPYEISNVSEFQAIGNDTASLGANYTLVSDINATATRSWNSRKGFDPIGACQDGGSGCTSDPFNGSFNGSGYTIANLTINRTVTEVGLFGATDGSTVQDVRLRNVSITGNITSTTDKTVYAGGLVGVNDGTVDSVFVSGQVDGVAINSTASEVVAGVVVGDNSGKLTQSVATANVTATAAFGAYAGGVAAVNDGRIEASVATGNVTAESSVNYPNGEYTYAGGLVGSNKNRIENAYATGDVDGDADVYVGGLVGYNRRNITTGTTGRITATYATGTLTATAGTVNKGGLVGINPTGTVDDSYFDNTPDNGIGTQLSTADMQGSSPPTTMTGLWDSTVWETVEAGDSDATADGYPILSAVERQRQLEQQRPNALTAIRNWDDLDAVRTDLAGRYFLADNLDDGVLGYDDVVATGANTGNGFDPIGSFSGTFDGRSRTIGNLMVDRATDKVGLFGSTQSSAMVEYVHLDSVSVAGNNETGGLVGDNDGRVRYATVDGSIDGRDNVGGLVGYSEGTVNASNATATINGSTDVGGLVGDLYQGKITASTASGDVDSTANNVGGLVGNANDGKRIENSSATGAVDGSNNVGGLVGVVGGTDISRSYATGVVDGANSVGGLIGSTYGTHDLSELYATGSVDGTSNVGGLIGYNDGFNSHVERSYAAGTVTATARPGIAGGLVGYNRGPVANTSANGTVTGRIAGGLVGSNEGTISNSIATGTVDSIGATGQAGGLVAINFRTAVDAYWDVNTTNQSTSTGGTGLTTANLTGQNVSDLAGLNDNSVWTPTDSYPVLRWRVQDLDLSLADTDLDVGDSTAATTTLSLAGGGPTTATTTSNYSSDSAVATVDGGTVTTSGSGTATITAVSAGRAATAELSVIRPSGGGSVCILDVDVSTSDDGTESTADIEQPNYRDKTAVTREDSQPLAATANTSIESLSLVTDTYCEFSVTVQVDETTDGTAANASFESPAVVSTTPVGYLTIQDNLAAEELTEATITFSVDTATAANGTITLYRGVGDEWRPMNTTVVNETSAMTQYEVDTSEFSTFAIGLDQPQTGTDPVEGTDEAATETDAGTVDEPDDGIAGLLWIGLLLIVGLLSVGWWRRDDADRTAETGSE